MRSTSASAWLRRAAVVALVGASLAGCAEYLDHSDKITAGAGDAVAWNNEVQAVHHIPQPHSNNRIGISGKRAEVVYQQWLIPPAAPAPVVNLNVAPPAAPPAP